MSYKLQKPYTEKQKADFVCQYQGMIPIETKNAFCFLEEYEIIKDGEIIDISTTNNYQETKKQKENVTRKIQLQSEIQELDNKRIRAIAEPSIKDKTTGQTWLEYYTEQIGLLREEIAAL